MITPEYIDSKQKPPLQVVEGGLETEAAILERLKVYEDKDHKDVLYGLRLLVANYLDLTTDQSARTPAKIDGRYGDILNKRWEEGRHNSLATNTLIQVKSLVFAEPDIKWTGCTGKNPVRVSQVRSQYYLKYWREQSWEHLYRRKLLDLIVCGIGNVQVGTRDGGLFMEWVDSLDVTWDNAYKEPHLKRFVYRDIHLPISSALRYFPKLRGKVRMPDPKTGEGGETIVTVRVYWSKTTTATIFKNEIVDGPKANPYGQIPIRLTQMIHQLSAKHPSGIVEAQVGTHKLDLRLQRYFRNTVLTGVPVGVAIGHWNEEALDDLIDGKEGTILRSTGLGSEFKYAAGAEIQRSALELQKMVSQQQNSESGVNDFMRSQTDTNVDFASQLAYIAQESGVQGKFTAQVHAEGLKDDARLFMSIASRFEPGPITLSIEEADITFDQSMPINPLLGDDGQISVKPMEYKSPEQKLQAQMILGNVLAIGANLPPGFQEQYWLSCLHAAEVDNVDDWMAALKAGQQQMAQQQAQMAAAQQGPPPPTPQITPPPPDRSAEPPGKGGQSALNAVKNSAP